MPQDRFLVGRVFLKGGLLCCDRASSPLALWMAGSIRSGAMGGRGRGRDGDGDENTRFTAPLISALPEGSGDTSSEDGSLVSGDSLGPEGVR